MEQAILLDTNVLSELMRPQPDVQVLAWFEKRGDSSRLIPSLLTLRFPIGGQSRINAHAKNKKISPPNCREARRMLGEDISGAGDGGLH